jgi:hypothetical protein
VTLQTLALGAYHLEVLVMFCTLLKNKRRLDVTVRARLRPTWRRGRSLHQWGTDAGVAGITRRSCWVRACTSGL